MDYKQLGTTLRVLGYDKKTCKFITALTIKRSQRYLHPLSRTITNEDPIYRQVDSIHWAQTPFTDNLLDIYNDLEE